jgi:transposase
VATWRRRFAEHRLEGLTDAPRPGAPRSIGDEAVERLVALTLEEAPRGAAHWTTAQGGYLPCRSRCFGHPSRRRAEP